MSRIASYFLINIVEADSVSGYSSKRSTKRIKAIYLKTGIYLCFVDEILLTKDKNERFCEVLYEDELIILRYRDIINLVI